MTSAMTVASQSGHRGPWTADYLIIGGGTAGSVIAARLAEDPSVTVGLIEAGPSDEERDEILSVRDWIELLGTEYDYDYTIEPQPRGNSAIRHSRARVLGGCSSHNSCIAFRIPDGDLIRWVAEGAEGWGPAQMAPLFEKVMQKVALAEPPGENPLNEAVLQAAEQAGLPQIIFAHDGSFTQGAGRFTLNVKEGIRQSSSVAYLHPLSALPPNLHLLTETKVLRILWEGDRAVGVETNQGVLRATREVILCAGAFDTPKLLLLSGVGPADHLQEIGIPVQIDLPGVGQNLMDHPEGVVVWASSQPIPEPICQFWEVGIFAHTGLDSDPLPDLMFHFGLMPFTTNTEMLGYPSVVDGFSLTPNVCRSRSRGRVWLAGGDPSLPPRIDFRYFTDEEGYDEAVMVAGVELAREIGAQPALAEWVKEEIAPGLPIQDRASISEYVRRSANTVYHPAGTCKIGRDGDSMAVVDASLRVRGCANLRVADASVFPSMPTVNPAITCMMVGEKAAQLIQAI